MAHTPEAHRTIKEILRSFLYGIFSAVLVPLPQLLPHGCGVGFIGASTAEAQEITIGVPELPRTLNFLIPTSQQLSAAEHLAGSLIRDAVTRTLIAQPNSAPTPYGRESGTHASAPGGDGAFSLELSDSVHVSPDQREWRLRIRREQTFTNGRPIRSEDVVYSLEGCIKNVRGRSGRQSGFSVAALDGATGRENRSGAQDSWVMVRDNGQGAFALRLTELLSSCPIIERQSSELFGDQLGIGSNVVGSGRFKIQSIDAGREYHLQQVRFGTTKTKKIVLRALKDGVHALTALRSGTVDVIFFDSEEVLSKASADQTLLISDCSGYKFVHRRALRVECRGQITAIVPSTVYAKMVQSRTTGSGVAETGLPETGVTDSERRDGLASAATAAGGGVLVGGGLFGRPPVFGPAPIDLAGIHYVS